MTLLLPFGWKQIRGYGQEDDHKRNQTASKEARAVYFLCGCLLYNIIYSTTCLSTLNYLRSADTCLTRTVIYWLSAPAITDSVNIMHRFRWSFQPNSLAHTRSIVSVLPSGDHKQCFISRVYACEMNHVITASQVFCFEPGMSKKTTILSFDQ